MPSPLDAKSNWQLALLEDGPSLPVSFILQLNKAFGHNYTLKTNQAAIKVMIAQRLVCRALWPFPRLFVWKACGQTGSGTWWLCTAAGGRTRKRTFCWVWISPARRGMSAARPGLGVRQAGFSGSLSTPSCPSAVSSHVSVNSSEKKDVSVEVSDQ